MSHPCSATVWHNNGMHGAPAAAKAVVGCADHSLTMVRPAAVLDHSMRHRNKTPAVWEEDIRADLPSSLLVLHTMVSLASYS